MARKRNILIPVFLIVLASLTSAAVFGDTPVVVTLGRPAQLLKDQKTKVVYYVESDRRHVAAISPDGKLLWRCQVLRATTDWEKGFYISSLEFWHPGDYPAGDIKNGEDYLYVLMWKGGGGCGTINKKTGVFAPGPTL
jgi:hypothetical protein